MKIVLDTNILISSLSRYSPYHWIFESILKGQLELCITNEILFEYEEVIGRIFNRETAGFTIETILNHHKTQHITHYFRWALIKSDFDDNKFVDCAIASNADYILTNDKHFQELTKIDFPKINVISLNDFEIKHKF